MRSCCTDHDGKDKKKYKTREEAEKVAQLGRDEGVGLKVYECEERDGWHLTSRFAPLPARAGNVMTQEDRALYARKEVNSLGDLPGEEAVSNLENEIERSTRYTHETQIEQLKRYVEVKAKIIQSYRIQIAKLQKDLQSAEQEFTRVKQILHSAEREYERAKRRIDK